MVAQIEREVPFLNQFGMNMLITTAASSIYGVAFIPLYTALGAGAAAISALPVAVTGWALGLRGGILAGVIAFPLNILLLNLVGEPGWDAVIRSGGAAGTVVLVLIGGTVGRIRDLREKLKSELDERNRLLMEREELVSELQGALSDVKTLSGLLPICALCKSIRDDDGYWDSIEKYIKDHSNAELTHGICPKCAQKLYPGLSESPT